LTVTALNFGTEAAHRNVAAFAAVALDGHAGDALQRLGDVLVGQLAQVFRGDRVDDSDGLALDVDGLLLAGADAGDDDLFDASRSPERRRVLRHGPGWEAPMPRSARARWRPA
jgi:hypothetical protein